MLNKRLGRIDTNFPKISLPENVKTPILQIDTTLDEIENTLLGISSKKEATSTLQKVENTWAYLITFELLGSEIVKGNPEIKKTLEDCEQSFSDLRIAIKTVCLGEKMEGDVPGNLKFRIGKTKAYIIVIEDLASKLGISGSIKEFVSNAKVTAGEIEDALWGLTSKDEIPQVIEKVYTLCGIVT